MPGLVPGIHVFLAARSHSKTWMAGPSPAMTRRDARMTTLRELKRKWMKDPDVRREYDALEDEFALILEVANARKRARLSWPEVARRMQASRSTIARLENGRLPSTRTLGRFAKATGHRLKISFEPMEGKKRRG